MPIVTMVHDKGHVLASCTNGEDVSQLLGGGVENV